MEDNNENFLRYLYYKRFGVFESEKRLRDIHKFDDQNAEIRNDQSVLEVSKSGKILDDIIKKFLEIAE